MSSRNENALWTAVWMLLAIVAIVAIVFGYKHCQAVDERIQQCMAVGNHSAAECRDAFAMEHSR